MTTPPRVAGCFRHFLLADEAGEELIDARRRRPTLEDVLIELTGRPWSQTTEEVRL